MATASFKRNIKITDKKVLKELKKAFEKPKKLDVKEIDWEDNKKRGKALLRRLSSVYKK